MKTRISKDRKHAGDLLALFKKMERRVEKEAPIPFYQDLLQHYDKAIKILRKHKHEGSAVSDLEDKLYQTNQTLRKAMAQSIARELSNLKNNLEREREA